MSPADELASLLDELALDVFERGWLSSNTLLFRDTGDTPATVVDTGYAAHADQTVALIALGLQDRSLGRIVNTHLHSDHCGGNAALQARWPVTTWIPAACLDAVQAWDMQSLSFEATDQRCDRFAADHGLSPGDLLEMGSRVWEVHAAPGHDPTALMFFEPRSAVLITGDALWERRLAIVFPELVGEEGFDACLQTLDRIERLAPRWVIPGHGRPFLDVASALAASRERVEAFLAAPDKHLRHALRALVMFRMLEIGSSPRRELEQWLEHTPITSTAVSEHGPGWAQEVIAGLVHDRVLALRGDELLCTT